LMVMDRAVMAAVLLIFTPSSSKKAPLALITVATVTPPFPVTGTVTVRAMVVVWVRLPLVPVTVTLVVPAVAVPAVAVLAAVKVSVLVPVVDAGLKLAVTPAGSPLALKDTLPVNPPVGLTVMVAVAVPACATLTFAGLESEKLGVLLATVRAIVVV